jgi:hypothetical protein
MGDVYNLFSGRATPGKKLPKPRDCKDCGDPIEAARLQAFNDGMTPVRCISCARALEKRFNRQMQAIREHQAVEIIR